MKYGQIVLKVNMHWLMESDFQFDVRVSKQRPYM